MAGSTVLKVEGAKILRKNSTISNPRDAGVRDLAIFARISERDLIFGKHTSLDHI